MQEKATEKNVIQSMKSSDLEMEVCLCAATVNAEASALKLGAQMCFQL